MKRSTARINEWTENREGILAPYDPTKGDLALLVVDVQGALCYGPEAGGTGNEECVRIARQIGSLVPHFRAAGVHIYGIYTPGLLAESWSDVDAYGYMRPFTEPVL